MQLTVWSVSNDIAMKPHATKSAPRFQLIEPLEARIAPATIRIGATGVQENITDTEYRESIDPFDPNRAKS